MPKKKITTPPPTKSFQKEIEKALKQINNPKSLGTNSPLAAPYFLAEYLHEQRLDGVGPYKQGVALQTLLKNMIDTLNKQKARLLCLYYLDDLSEEETYTELLMSKATFQRHRKKAISELSQALSSHLKPALRAEVPRPRGNLLERQMLTGTCLRALKQGRSIGLTGLGGVGKTVLGQHIATQTPPAFWFTFRLGLNDNFGTLIFALGSFLAGQGASALWSQLIADKGQVEMDKALGLVRYDLNHLASKRPVLCFDEVDQLGEVASLHLYDEDMRQSPLLPQRALLLELDTNTHMVLSARLLQALDQ